MSTWIHNLKTRLEDRPVVILHGNVREKYIDAEGRVYENLTALLTAMSQALPLSFAELVFYDPVGHERRQDLTQLSTQRRAAALGNDELAATASTAQPASQRIPPSRVLANWVRQWSANNRNCFVTVFYLDKLVAYKTAYQDDEREILLWLEKVIENMTPNHRLVLVALQDTLIPIELYTNSPKTCVLPIPIPEKTDRLAYLKHRLGEKHPHLELVGDLTDGLFLRDLDSIVSALSGQADLGTREVRRLVNRYRIGEQEDRWGTLSNSRRKS